MFLGDRCGPSIPSEGARGVPEGSGGVQGAILGRRGVLLHCLIFYFGSLGSLVELLGGLLGLPWIARGALGASLGALVTS